MNPRTVAASRSCPQLRATCIAIAFLPFVLAGCGSEQVADRSDSGAGDSSAVDTSSVSAAANALTLSDSTRVVIDTASVGVDTAIARAEVPTVAPATVRNGSDRIDLLISEIAQLRSQVSKLEAAPALQQKMPSTTAVVDTLRANARERVKETAQDVQNFGLRAFWAVLLMAGAFFLIKCIVWILETLSERSARRRLFFKKLIPITRILVWIVVVYYVVAGVFEVDKQGLLAAGAAVGVAVGFAAQDVLKNIFGGILIILDQPFQVGDRVRVGGTYGEVVSIGLRSTRIVTPDDNLVSVPNTQVVDGQVANANAGALDCQVVTELYLPGWIDVSRAKEIAYDAAANSKFVFLKKPIVVLVQDEFKETFLTRVVVKAYVIDARYEARFASDITETAKTQYLQEGMLAEFYPGAADSTNGTKKEDPSRESA